MPFKPLLSQWDTSFTYHGKPMTVGKVIVNFLRFMLKSQNTETVVDVQTCDEMFSTIQFGIKF